LWPWRPDRVQIFRANRDDPNAPLVYRYKFANQTYVDLPADHVLHLRGLGLDGIVGLSPIETHKQAVGYSMAITEHGARFFSNGARPLGYIKHPNTLSDKAKQSLKESWQSAHQGLSNAHRVAVLEEAAEYKEVGLNMVDAQYLEQMKFTIEDIARIYGVPLHKLASLDQATNNNIEHQGKEYVDSCLGPLTCNWEQELEYSLLSARDRDNYCLKFRLRHLLRGDMAAQAAFYGALMDRGAMTQNEVREDIDMNPMPGKLPNIPWKNAAMVPTGDDSYSPPGQPSANPPPGQKQLLNGKVLTQ
jgi:HK97 family phage portal protein